MVLTGPKAQMYLEGLMVPKVQLDLMCLDYLVDLKHLGDRKGL